MNKGDTSSGVISLDNRKEFQYEIFYNPVNSVIREFLKRGLGGNNVEKVSGMILPIPNM